MNAPGSMATATSVESGDKSEPAPPLLSAMLILGDQWILLILQQAFLNRVRRFNQWREILGISDSVLADRLKELVIADIFRLSVYHDGHRRREEYLLTERGLDLWPLLVCMWTWEEQWVTRGESGLWLEHRSCHGSTLPFLMCVHCGKYPVSAHDTDTIDSSGGTITGGSRQRHHRRATRSLNADHVISYDAQTLAILGDRWSTLVLGSAFLGAGNFMDFRERLRIGPSVLSDRLKLFLSFEIFKVVPAHDRRVRRFRLTPKGLAFFPVFALMNDWADVHLVTESGAQDLVIVHQTCGQRLEPRLACSACHEPIARREMRYHDRSGRSRLANDGTALGS